MINILEQFGLNMAHVHDPYCVLHTPYIMNMCLISYVDHIHEKYM